MTCTFLDRDAILVLMTADSIARPSAALPSTSRAGRIPPHVFFLVFNATVAGVRAVDEHLTNALRIMRAKTWHVHTMATLPSAVVWIIEGLRTSVPWAVVATATAEIMSSNEGMGYLITRSASQFYTQARRS